MPTGLHIDDDDLGIIAVGVQMVLHARNTDPAEYAKARALLHKLRDYASKHGINMLRTNPTPKDYELRKASAYRGKESHTFEESPHTKTVAEVRALLARRKDKDKCSPDCPGWAVFDTERGHEIEVCDECNTEQTKAMRVSDDDVAQLAEAQKALREATAGELEDNPRRRRR